MSDSTVTQKESVNSLTILQRIAKHDRAAIAECVDTYGNFIWALARKYTDSNEKAETVAREIFKDIWRYAESGEKSQIAENIQIALIVQRRMIKFAANGNWNREMKNREDKSMENSEHIRVLYAENNEDDCSMVTYMLKHTNIEVVTAGTIAEAWHLAKSEKFNLYLMGTRFPDGYGFDLCSHLRKFAPQTPILFYSADAFEKDIKKGMSAGANLYLVKPYFGDLAETVRQAIEYTEKKQRKIHSPYFETSTSIFESLE